MDIQPRANCLATTSLPASQHITLWAAGNGAVIELGRLAGPHTGIMKTPIHLLPAPPTRLDLDDPADRALLYTACLRFGDPYDVYRYVNPTDLAEVLPSLPLPDTLRRLWAHALRDSGVPIPAPDPTDKSLDLDLSQPRPNDPAVVAAAGGG